MKSVDGVKAARIEILEERVELYDTLTSDLKEKLREIHSPVRPAHPYRPLPAHKSFEQLHRTLTQLHRKLGR